MNEMNRRGMLQGTLIGAAGVMALPILSPQRALSAEHVTNVCIGQGGANQCRYLSKIGEEGDIYECLKGGEEKAKIDAELRLFHRIFTKVILPWGHDMLPNGDNCDGKYVPKEQPAA